MRIKVMADYSSLGLWDKSGQLDISKVKISNEFQTLLREWITEFKKRIDWSDPKMEVFLSDEDKIRYNDLEDRVFALARKELGTDNELEFRSDKFEI